MSDIPHIKVRQAMSPEVHLIEATATVREAMALMHRHRVSSLVVPRRDDKDELGIIGVINIADRVIAENRSLDRTDVYEVMIKPVLPLDADMDIRYAVRLLTRFRLNRAVVVDHDRNLLGLVTLRDMVLSYVHLEEEGIEA
jgi:predicted transcriptional regulator